MNVKLVSTIAGALALALLGVCGAAAQQAPAPAPVAAAPVQAAAQYTPEQLDQMLAPIALYSDTLLGQVLMAATYPLEVVEADRWLQQPGNAALKGAQLAAALDPLPWDPSVKSLVPFPQVLRMMDGHLDWTERLGEAFLADQAGVMDSVQRLRHRAQTAGKLVTSPQQVVTTVGPDIVIEPPSPEIVYVPVYSPFVVYGPWPYAEYPPFWFPEFFPGVVIGGFGFGWFGVAIVVPLWGWERCEWREHHIVINRERFAALNRHVAPPGAVWEHSPEHRHGVPYHAPALNQRFPGTRGAPEVQRGFRGFGPGAAPMPRVVNPPEAAPRPPAFESFGRGPEVRAQAQRGQESRAPAPHFVPQYAPRGGGAQRGGAGVGRGRS